MSRTEENGWQLVSWADCPWCGGDVEIFTDCTPDWYWDGDPARCLACNETGTVGVSGGDVFLDWDCEKGVMK